MDFVFKDRYGIGDLLEIVRILREPGGCPWDREQTHASIRQNLIEETYEVADAIDQNDAHLLCEELGDLLLQIALHTQMEREAGTFTFDDVCDGISKKLIYRHPHVFGNLDVNGTDEVLRNWEDLKNAEKQRETAAQRLDSVPASLPALMRSAKLQKRAAAFGFCYPGVDAALADLDSEVEELKAELAPGAPQDGARQRIAGEVGDVLFSAVNVARMLGIDPEEALSGSSNTFADRVKRAEQLAGKDGKTFADLDEAALDAYWKEAKRLQREKPSP